jgi:hypothetical protein
MVTLEAFPNVYCPTCRGVKPARFEVLKADAYIDHDSLDIVCSQSRSVNELSRRRAAAAILQQALARS